MSMVAMSPQMQQMAERMRALREGRMPAAMSPAPAAAPAALVERPEMLTLEEAAKECRVSLPTFKKWNVPRFEEGRIILIRRKDLEDFVASRIKPAHDDVQKGVV